MACPFFEPQNLLEDPIFARLPLGQAYSGSCTLAPSGSALPLKICNHGYARGRCPHFPASFAVDAYRYSQIPGGETIWIEEADHAPLRFASATEIPANNTTARIQRDVFQRAVKEGKIK